MTRSPWPLLLVLAACQSAGSDLAALALEPPLPYSVLVTGGAFLTPEAVSVPAAPRQRTYRPEGPLAEAFPLHAVLEALQRARVFERAQLDEAPVEQRARLVGHPGVAAADSRELEGLLARAQRSGHDLLLVLERVQDGPVEARGINGQWPITAAVWISIGLGVLIPDHTYESAAALHVSLREVETGRALYERVLAAGTVDLPLIQRGSFLGLVQSIVVPPFWVGDDDEAVEATVRGVTSERLVASMARQLKSVDVQARLHEQAPAILAATHAGSILRVQVDAQESLSFVRVRIDGVVLQSAEMADFERRLLASAQPAAGGRVLYAEALREVPSGVLLQLLVQTVSGGVASITTRMQEEG